MPGPADERRHNPGSPGRTVWILGILAAVVFGGVSFWEGRFDMDPDGIAYLDMADAYARRDWENALNSVWSPLYSWMLIPVLRGLKPSAYWEFPVVQGANFLIYLGALGAFLYFLGQLMRYQAWRTVGDGVLPSEESVPTWMVYAAGYAVFLWGCLIAIGVTHVGPHLAIAALTFVTTGLLLRIRMHPNGTWNWAALGLVLGLTYLARAQSLVFVPVYLGLAVLGLPGGWWRVGRMVLRPLLALGFFVVLASVYAIPLFTVKNQIAGHALVRLNYAWYVNGVPILHWQGHPPFGVPVHPTRVLSTAPMVNEFDGPIGGTYPPWYDPSYWYEGVQPRFSMTGHLRRLVESVMGGGDSADFMTFFSWSPSALVLVLVAVFLARRRMLSWNSLRDHAPLLVPALVALATYPTLTILPGRFLGAFLPIVWVGLVAALAGEPGRERRSRTTRMVAVGICLFHLAILLAITGARTAKFVAASVPHEHWEVATALHSSGVHQGSKVAAFGRPRHAYWARLARVTIVADMRSRFVQQFWDAPGDRRRDLLTKLQATGVKAIVFHRAVRPDVPPTDVGDTWRWTELNGTGYLALIHRP
jgi:hypothetical protein